MPGRALSPCTVHQTNRSDQRKWLTAAWKLKTLQAFQIWGGNLEERTERRADRLLFPMFFFHLTTTHSGRSRPRLLIKSRSFSSCTLLAGFPCSWSGFWRGTLPRTAVIAQKQERFFSRSKISKQQMKVWHMGAWKKRILLARHISHYILLLNIIIAIHDHHNNNVNIQVISFTYDESENKYFSHDTRGSDKKKLQFLSFYVHWKRWNCLIIEK